ncbi:pyridoxal phosphate-dependent decarboxylase family protein [Streptomyces clavuligerus]|uniref:Pyridoxal-dependent decarboxylase n=1 Tax=Streptomyces clavuligerus TaxID=1901 RepID=D5SLL3_STRCL|nr:aminotransferase class V-fold PLP-dependent enzyme [Streptomyces clavuligerus]EFG04806.1 Pyridoxal-dependent decarboxylase [Streptomyces clavuligerus]MBY6306748.1 aminotransferase class V-fold PLP-dependent enzyme [Streptomyces clavuligerus]QCS10647.1 aminotransferase class V-fold PLP-dependent enzyme [Streptomyces clavuligerus]QPJ97316.1 aminotransferase class V-fold PLP-dependent enzyme [Streptomyces clavuligerus]WDN57359.1 aminotransferase class V-fold PLP-dependent enzyme [Streptomyces 
MHEFTPAVEQTVRELARLSVARLASDVPLGGAATQERLESAAGETITAAGLGGARAIELWTEVLAPACLTVDHPRYLSFIPGAPAKLASAFDMLVGVSNVYGGSWLEGAGAAFAENQALRWIADLAGLPEGAGGTFVQGGTLGNLSALVAARETARRQRSGAPGRWAVCVSDEAHSSVTHALRVVMDADVVLVPGDERGRMTGGALRAVVDGLPPERRAGVFAVVATAGSTNLGTVDDLAGIAEVARENGWWLHVDGAYGGAGLAAGTVRHLYDGVQWADSFIVDPHKWLFGPFDSCALLYRDPALARAAHTQHAAYLEPVAACGGQNPSDHALQLTRRSRGLPFWFSLAVHGSDAYRDAVERTLATARAGAELIRRSDHLDLLVEPDLTVLTFARRGWGADDYARWSDGLLASRQAFVTPTGHRGRACTRLAVVNPATTPDDLRLVLDSMR